MNYRNRYFLVRHGHSEANQAGKIVSSPATGLDTCGLSALGAKQLERLVTEWPWPHPTRIYHSDFLRTMQTAERIAAHFDLPLRREERLRERFFGEFDGMPDHFYHNIWKLDAEDAGHARFGVESVVNVARRMRTVIDVLEAHCQDEIIILVSHGDPLQILLTALERRPLSQHRDRPALAPASVTPVMGQR